jgi:uncharacterized protein YjbI with pentapeptide repeats
MDRSDKIMAWIGGSFLLAIFLFLFLFLSYSEDWTATGFPGKTLWDWLQLLIVPLALALIALVFQFRLTRVERRIAQDKFQGDLLQGYLDRLSTLLLERGLRTAPEEAEVRTVARVQTLTTLKQLDARRAQIALTFLGETGLMKGTKPIIDLSHADLNDVRWSKIQVPPEFNLSQSELNHAQCSASNLSQVILIGCQLCGADLQNAVLSEAILDQTQLVEGKLKGAKLNHASLREANLHLVIAEHAQFEHADLTKANLSGYYRAGSGAATSSGSVDVGTLIHTNLKRTNFQHACLREANLTHADLTGATLKDALLKGADLRGAIVTDEQLEQADSYERIKR